MEPAEREGRVGGEGRDEGEGERRKQYVRVHSLFFLKPSEAKERGGDGYVVGLHCQDGRLHSQ